MAVLTRYNHGTAAVLPDSGRKMPVTASFRLFRDVAWKCLLVALGVWIALYSTKAGAAVDSPLEYRVKAAFLLNFCKFVTWPENTFEKNGDPIVLCVIGQSPFGEALSSIAGKKAQGHPLEIRHALSLEDAGACHMLFFGESMLDDLDQTLPGIQNKPILTVGDMSEFVRNGCMIGFVLSGSNIRFMINRTAAETAGIKISSHMLKLAIIFDTPDPDGNHHP